MRKYFIAIVLLMYASTALSLTGEIYGTYNGLAGNLNGTYDWEQYLQENFVYERNYGERDPGYKFLEERIGDCNMYSEASALLYSHWDIPAYFVCFARPAVNPKNRVHVVCMYREKGIISVIDIDKSYTVTFHSWQEMASHFDEDWIEVRVYKVYAPRRRSLVKRIIPEDEIQLISDLWR